MKNETMNIIKWIGLGLLIVIAAWSGLKLIWTCGWFGDILAVISTALAGVGIYDIAQELKPWIKKEEKNEEPTEHPTED